MVYNTRTVSVRLLCVCVLSISGASARWLANNNTCSTPDGAAGNCIPVKQCQPITDFIMKAPKPLTQEVVTHLRTYVCANESSSVEVCCPPTSITWPDDDEDDVQVTTTEPSPAEVPNAENSIIFYEDMDEHHDNCSVPAGGLGRCIPLSRCKVMTDFLKNASRPFSGKVLNYINSYTCGFEISSVKVCCPVAPFTSPGDKENVQETENRSAPNISSHDNFNLLPEDCGYINEGNKIKNGVNANLNEFPWMALLSYQTKNGPQFQCGGTIVNDKWILTAAHCITNLKQPLLGVRVGEYNILTREDCEVRHNGIRTCTKPVQNLAIEEVHAHPQYDAIVINNDIGLLKVTKMNLQIENVRPVCLPTDNSVDTIRSKVVVTGWGITATGRSSTVLQKVLLPLVDPEACQNSYKADRRVQITRRHICAGGKGEKDSCPGDSGGPLQRATFLNDEARYVQEGIVSYGARFCGTDGYPGVYTKVVSYMDWVLDTIHE